MKAHHKVHLFIGTLHSNYDVRLQRRQPYRLGGMMFSKNTPLNKNISIKMTHFLCFEKRKLVKCINTLFIIIFQECARKLITRNPVECF